MNYEKTVMRPAVTHSFERLTPSRMREGDGVERMRLYHMLETDRGLECAEGCSISHYVNAGSARIYVTDGYLFDYNPTTQRMMDLVSRGTFNGVLSPPHVLVSYVSPRTGNQGWFIVTDERMSYMYPGTILHYAYTFGGKGGAVHHERLFMFDGQRVFYSPALEFADFTTMDEDANPDGAGHFDLYSDNGDFVAAVSFRERLYLFRKRGLARVRADGEALGFSAEEVPYGCGALIPGSVVHCGDKIAFLTENGLFSFDGNKYTQYPAPILEEIDLTKEVQSSCFKGKYMACVSLKSGIKHIFMYDFGRERGYFLVAEALSADACGEGYLLWTNNFTYSLTERGLPLGGEACRMELTLHADKFRALEKFRIAGKGSFTVTVETEGGTAEFTLEGGETYRYEKFYFGRETKFTITTKTVDFCIEALELNWRAEHDD